MARVDYKQSVSNFRDKYLTVSTRKWVYISLGILTAIITFCSIYFGLMPINFASNAFRAYLVCIALLWCVPLLFKVGKGKKVKQPNGAVKVTALDESKIKNGGKLKVLSGYGVPLFIAGALLAVYIILSISTSPLFMAKKYRDLIDVKDNAPFSEIESYDKMQIPVVDGTLAVKLGDKKLGEGNYGSQFEVGEYTMIKYQGKLVWVAPIEYQGFFQWTNKKTSPGYVIISALDPSDVKIVQSEMKYVDSGYFSDDLKRKMYFANMFKFREGKPHLELDENGNPMFIDAVMTKKFALTSGEDAVGVVITDAKTGASAYYATEDVPEWVDRIQPAETVYKQLDYWGKYVNGFFNTLFSKKDVLTVSEGASYIHSNGEMLLYTGVTSVGSDESIVGVAMINMRTKETKFYRVSGATEYAAAQSAIGAEQSQRFTSSHPILINVNNVPTYFMTLKDDEGLIKRYAYVNVADYTVVSVNEAKDIALTNYLMKVAPQEIPVDIPVEITGIKEIVWQNNTVYLLKFKNSMPVGDPKYVEGIENIIFKAKITEPGITLDLAFMNVGDKVKIDYLLGTEENLIIKITKVTE